MQLLERFLPSPQVSITRPEVEQRIDIVPSTVSPPPKRPAWLKPVVLGSIFVLTVIVMRAPTPDRVFHTLPANTGDPALVAWIMSWDVHALVTHPLHLFDAPIFWPRTLTLAYSDLMLPAAPFYGLLVLVDRQSGRRAQPHGPAADGGYAGHDLSPREAAHRPR